MKHLHIHSGVHRGALVIADAGTGACQRCRSTPKAEECFLAAKRSVAELRSGDVNGGIKICQSALDDGNMAAHDRAGTYINLGVLYAAENRHDIAMDDYERGIRLSPDLGDAYVDRGAALIFLKRYDDALVDINKGIALGLSYEFVGYFNRAVAEFYKGQFKESYFDYKHTLELAPDFKPAQDQLQNFIVTKTPAKGG